MSFNRKSQACAWVKREASDAHAYGLRQNENETRSVSHHANRKR